MLAACAATSLATLGVARDDMTALGASMLMVAVFAALEMVAEWWGGDGDDDGDVR